MLMFATDPHLTRPPISTQLLLRHEIEQFNCRLCGRPRRAAPLDWVEMFTRGRALRRPVARECRSRPSGRPDLLREQGHDPRSGLRAGEHRHVRAAVSSPHHRQSADARRGGARRTSRPGPITSCCRSCYDRPDATLHQVGVYYDVFRRVDGGLKLAQRRCVYDNLLVDNALCIPV